MGADYLIENGVFYVADGLGAWTFVSVTLDITEDLVSVPNVRTISISRADLLPVFAAGESISVGYLNLNGGLADGQIPASGGSLTPYTIQTSTTESQTITFNTIPDKIFGDAAFVLEATASSSLDVTFSIVSGPVLLSENTLSIMGAGMVVIKASQAGNSNYSPAPDVEQTFEIAKANQVITIETIEDKLLDAGNFDVVASVDTDLELSYSVSSGPATISGTIITLDGSAGTVVVVVSQAGNENYKPAEKEVAFNVATITGINNLEFNATVHPNPSNGIFTISLQTKISKVQVFNSNGGIVFEDISRRASPIFNLTSLPKGIYILIVQTKNQVFKQRIQLF